MIIRILIEINFNMTRVTTGLLTSLMVFILVMQGNVSRSIPGDDNNIANDFECHTDNDCTEKNSFCNINLNLCSQCLNCNIYFRMPKKNIQCPKDISDCSTCLDGYSEEVFFGGDTRETCVLIDSNVLPTPAKISLHSYWEDYGIIFIVTNVSLFTLFSLLWSYFYKRMRNINSIVTSNSLQDNPDNQLPSYDSCMKLDHFVTDDVQEFHLFTGEQPPRNEWRHQNAVPFRLPKVDTGEINNFTDEEDDIEEVDGTIQRVLEIEDPELHDEETMPSLWCPLPPLSPQLPEMSRIEVQNNLENCQPPFKRIKLTHQSADEKNNQDEDNTSDMSQDGF